MHSPQRPSQLINLIRHQLNHLREKISLHQPVLSNFLNKEGRIEGEFETEIQNNTSTLPTIQGFS